MASSRQGRSALPPQWPLPQSAGRAPTGTDRRRAARRGRQSCSAQLPQLLLDALGQEDLEERLVGNVALVGEHLEILDQPLRQAEGDGLRRGLELRERGALGATPIQVLGRVVGRPELPLLLLGLKSWDRLQALALGHFRIPFARAGSCLAPR